MRDQRGIAHVIVFVLVLVLMSGLGFVAYQKLSRGQVDQKTSDNNSGAQESGGALWQWDGQKWAASGNAPECDDPVLVQSPTDVSKVSAILYPGQTRGGNYKGHGGFRFEQADNKVEVTAPIDARLVEGSRYIEMGEVQNYFIFINDCGIAYKLDHLLTLTPKFQKIADTLPEAKPNDSRTTKLSTPVLIKAGEVIATEVGFKELNNVSFDFGLLDLRKENGFTLSGNQSDPNFKQFNAYSLCWLDNLKDSESGIVKALPAGDGQNGSTSDYCN